MDKLLRHALLKFTISMIILAAIIIIPAGTLRYWNAWLYLGSMLVLMTIGLIYLYKYDPALLEKRININEKQKEQKTYVKLSVLLLLTVFIVPGLDYRFNWSHVPLWLIIVSLVIMILSYVMFLGVLIQNSYASRVIEIQDGQKLIDTGLYSVVRHPMYLSASLLYMVTPLVLGSYYALIPIAFLPLLLAYRIINEERLLIDGLKGYKEYAERVKYRLIPNIW